MRKVAMTTLRKGQGRGDAAPSKGGETTKRRVRATSSRTGRNRMSKGETRPRPLTGLCLNTHAAPPRLGEHHPARAGVRRAYAKGSG